MKHSTLALVALTLALGACASGPDAPPPVPAPDSPSARPANSPAVILALKRARAQADAMPSREEIEAKRRAEYTVGIIRANRRLSRQEAPDARVWLPGYTSPVERTIVVRFDYGDARFVPEHSDIFRLRALIHSADRAIVRGRTDARGDAAANERMARRRAESARMWLVERGFPHAAIAINATDGDYVSGNERANGRDANRRVEVEFLFDDPRATDTAAR